MALGAGRRRLAGQLLAESTALALAGGTGGVLVAALCVRLLPLLQSQRLPGLLEQTRIDFTVLGFTLGLSLMTGLIFGMMPALAAPRIHVSETLKQGGRSRNGAATSRGWRALIISETALALVLAIGAGLLIRTFFYLRDEAPGFRADQLLTARITPPRGKFQSREQCIAYWNEVMRRVRAVPGVQAASFALSLPMTGDNVVASFPIEGHRFARPEDFPPLQLRDVETQYFRTMQIPLRRGRLFSEHDHAAAPRAAIINEAFARRFWPGQDPLGKRLDEGPDVSEVVGVVADVRAEDSTKAVQAEVYFHYLQMPTGRIALAVRADTRLYRDPLALEPSVRAAVAAIDSSLPVTQFAHLREMISERIAPKRLSAQLMAVFAALALALAAVGIYGVLSFSVAQRTQEIGIRVALGAQPGAVLRMIALEAAGLSAAGIGVGIIGALALTRILRSLLFGVSGAEPSVYVGSAAGLFAVAIIAALVPALRAARVDPLVALRQE
jgi:putative ABC transport system permease protein